MFSLKIYVILIVIKISIPQRIKGHIVVGAIDFEQKLYVLYLFYMLVIHFYDLNLWVFIMYYIYTSNSQLELKLMLMFVYVGFRAKTRRKEHEIPMHVHI